VIEAFEPLSRDSEDIELAGFSQRI